MMLDAELLARAKARRAKLSSAEHDLAMAKADYHHAVRTLHLAGGSLREVAAALGVSHQRVQQIVTSAGGSWWSRAWRNQRVRPDMLCSSCGLPPGEVAKLIAGPRVYICDGCVELAERAVESDQAAVSERATLARVAAGSRAKCSFCGKRAAGGSRSATCWICPPCLRLCRQILDDRGEPTPA